MDAAPTLTRSLAALHARSFTTPRPWSADEFASLLADRHCFVLNGPQGFLLGRVIAGEAELLTLAVAPEARRQGLATQLLAGFAAAAQARGAQKAFLEVAAGNLAAQALYARDGWQQGGRRKAYYRTPEGGTDDALVLWRSLGVPGF